MVGPGTKVGGHDWFSFWHRHMPMPPSDGSSLRGLQTTRCLPDRGGGGRTLMTKRRARALSSCGRRCAMWRAIIACCACASSYARARPSLSAPVGPGPVRSESRNSVGRTSNLRHAAAVHCRFQCPLAVDGDERKRQSSLSQRRQGDDQTRTEMVSKPEGRAFEASARPTATPKRRRTEQVTDTRDTAFVCSLSTQLMPDRTRYELKSAHQEIYAAK